MPLYLPYNQLDVQRAREKLEELIKRNVPFRLDEVFPQRTPQQGKYFFILRDYFASQYGITRKEVEDDIIKKECNPDIFIRVATDKEGNFKEYLRKTNTLTTKEMGIAIDRFKYIAATKYGIILPDADKQYDLLECEKEIENNTQYL